MSSLMGFIRRIDPDRTGGVIRCDDRRDIPFALSEILEYDAVLLAVGQRVIFALHPAGPARAVDIHIHRLTSSAPAVAKERELRFRGFAHAAGAREYRFEWVANGEAPRPAVVRVDLALFVRHHVRIQEGPALCAFCVNAAPQLAVHELTDQDFRDFMARQPVPGVRGAPKRTAAAAAARATTAS